MPIPYQRQKPLPLGHFFLPAIRPTSPAICQKESLCFSFKRQSNIHQPIVSIALSKLSVHCDLPIFATPSQAKAKPQALPSFEAPPQLLVNSCKWQQTACQCRTNLEKHSTSQLQALLIFFQLVHGITLAHVLMLVLVQFCAIYLFNLLRRAAKQLPQLSTIEIQLSLTVAGLACHGQAWRGMAERCLVQPVFRKHGGDVLGQWACSRLCLALDRLAIFGFAQLAQQWLC